MYKSVTKDVFDILSRHYKSEIRYYVDVTKGIKAKRAKANGHAAPESKTERVVLTAHVAREWKGKWKKDNLIALGRAFGNTRQSAAAGTITDRVTRAVDELYHKNAFTQFRRSTLIGKVIDETKLSGEQISPVVSKMITSKWLRVVDEGATSALDVPKAS